MSLNTDIWICIEAFIVVLSCITFTSANIQEWTPSEMIEEIKFLKDQFKDQQEDLEHAKEESKNLKQSLKTLTEELENLKDNPVPKDFIYVQLPWQKQPNEIWIGTAWEEVTKRYAGHFFRALGNESASFGIPQGGNAPRLIEVNVATLPSGPSHIHKQAVVEISGRSSGWLWTGNNPINRYARDQVGMDFKNSGGEVRPKNLAVKIWTRI